MQKLVTKSNSLWNPVIGLEIHAQLATKSKLFAPSGTSFNAPTNTQVACFDAAIPGTLPVLNRKAVEISVKTALALNCHLNLVSEFDRKHYFYADMPAGYQITQQRKPIAQHGYLAYLWEDGPSKKVLHDKANILQIQLEQDSGKSLHDPAKNRSLIDLNRAGVGLMEIVTGTDFKTGTQAGAFVEELRRLLVALGASSGHMWEGALRVDANVSLHRHGEPLGVRAEVKNLNSLRSVVKAIEYEICRQTEQLDAGIPITNETRSFDVETEKTVSMRDKEVVQDYRFFPEPNLPPLRLYPGCPSSTSSDSSSYPCDRYQAHLHLQPPVCITCLRHQLPKDLPSDRRVYINERLGVSLERTRVLVDNEGLYNLFIDAMKLKCSRLGLTVSEAEKIEDFMPWVRSAISWITGQLLGMLRQNNHQSINCPISVERLVDFVDLENSKEVSIVRCKNVFDIIYLNPDKSPRRVVEENDWFFVTDVAVIEEYCKQLIEDPANAKKVSGYKKGKDQNLQILTQQMMTKYKGKFKKETIESIIIRLLKL